MRYLLLIWLVLGGLSVNRICAQTLHVLAFADTDDPAIGSFNLKTYTSLMGTNGLASTIARQAGLTLRPMSYYGPNCRVEQLNQALDALRVGPDDVVLFYFVGHGFNNRQNEFPSLIFGNASAEPATVDAASRNLREIYARIRAKRPRLTIAIGDACNKERADPPAPVNSVRAIGVMPPQALSSERFKALFRQYQGGVLVSSSQRNQYSHTDAKGGWMSVSLANALNNWCMAARREPAEWRGLLDDVITRTGAMARQNNQEQEPQYVLELTPYRGGAEIAGRGIDDKPEQILCPPADQFVNEIALSGIKADMPLLTEMRSGIASNNAQAYAEAYITFYQNQKPFYRDLHELLFNEIDGLSTQCSQQFAQETKWLEPKLADLNTRFDVLYKHAGKPLELVQHARSQMPSILTRLNEILEKLDK